MAEHPMGQPWLDSVAFERLLSAKPQIGPELRGSEPCLRDLIFDRYREHFSEERADWFTKEYITKLWEVFNA